MSSEDRSRAAARKHKGRQPVEKFSVYDECFKCGRKVNIDEGDEEMGECARCNMVQCISECQKSAVATLTVKSDGGKTMVLRAFDKVILHIAEKPAVDDITLKVLS